MNRLDKILKNEKFRAYLGKTADYEKDRIYCLHDIAHAFDTARIAYIKSLEEGAKIDKELIYAAALIHDIGRCKQYEDSTPHDKASVMLGREILEECGFSETEISLILTAVSEHRAESGRSPLGKLLFEADNKSRMCMLCTARSTCKWKQEDMNKEVED